jgi:hypothetical protein
MSACLPRAVRVGPYVSMGKRNHHGSLPNPNLPTCPRPEQLSSGQQKYHTLIHPFGV